MSDKKLPSRISIPLLLGIGGILLTTVLASLFFSARNSELQRSFEAKANQITSLIDTRMTLYTNVLYGGQGLYAASDSVSEKEWLAYVGALDLPQHYRGMTSMLFIQRVPSDEVKTLPFTIFPYQEKSEYFPITYIASATVSTTSTSTIGFDISSEPGRRSAILAASSTREPSATPVVKSAGGSQIPVFSIYLPVYASESNTSTPALGYISATFRVKELFEGLASDPLFDRNMDVAIVDPDGVVLLDTSVSRSRQPEYETLRYTSQVIVGGRAWNLEFKALSSFSLGTFADVLPYIVLTIGFLLTGLLSLISYLFIVSRERDIASRSLQLDTLIRSFPYGVLVEDEKRSLQYANQRVLDLLAAGSNVTVKDIVGKNMKTLEAAGTERYADHEKVIRETKEIVSSGKMVINGKIELVDGRIVSRDYVPLYTGADHVGAIWILKDITEEENVDRMKTEFVSLASHQLRTPLTSIKWYAELLSDNAGELTTEQAEYVKEVSEAADRMNNLVTALLDISRLDLGTFIIEPTPEDIVAIMESAVHEQLPTFEKKKQQFSFTHPDGLAPVPVDKKLFFIIVQNLLSNAMKYSPEGASVHLSLEQNAQVEYVVSCTDTGYGIPAKAQANIFKKLFRADNIRTLDVEGTGLGLYMIKTIAEAAGCTIAFTSKEGKGTTFVFTVPASGMKAKTGTKTLGE
jgi:signal transduction histidine kinase